VQWPIIINIGIYKVVEPLTDEEFDNIRGEKTVKIIENLRIIRGKIKVFSAKGLKALLKGTEMIESFDKKEDQDENITDDG